MQGLSLYWRVCLINGAVFIAGALALAFSPARVSERVVTSEAVVLTIGLGAMLVLNALLLRGSIRPIDARLAMLEAEHTRANARALAAQEAERQRIATDLHDEVGQSLTAVLLGLKQLQPRVAPDVATDLDQIREMTRDSLDDVRRVVSRLRPDVLEDLGLHSALNSLCSDLALVSRIEVQRTFGRGVPTMTPAQDLVIYRVAQEALTNVARHSGATRVKVSLTRLGDRVVLEVTDNGTATIDPTPGSGLSGMRERAALIGADLRVQAVPGHGVSVRLEVSP